MEQEPSLSGLGYTPTLQLTATSRNREYWATRPEITQETSQKVREADVILIPEGDDFRDLGPYFPAGTQELYHSLHDKHIKAEIVAEDSNFNELARHFDLYIVGAFLLTSVALPAFVNFLSEYLNGRFLNKDKAAIHLEVTIEKTDGSTVRVDYEGPAKEFEKRVVPFLHEAVQKETPALPPADEADSV